LKELAPVPIVPTDVAHMLDFLELELLVMDAVAAVLVAGLLLFLLPLQDVFGIFPLPCVKHF
jgi:hypothetical protein